MIVAQIAHEAALKFDFKSVAKIGNIIEPAECRFWIFPEKTRY